MHFLLKFFGHQTDELKLESAFCYIKKHFFSRWVRKTRWIEMWFDEF